MKKNLFTLLIGLSLLFAPKNTYALFGVGDIVFDPTATAKLIYNGAIELGTKTAAFINAANTTALQIQAVIKGPLQDALTAIAIANSVNNIKNLIQGGLGNQQLIKTSPSQYIIGQGKNSVTVNLNTVRTVNGAYSNSILNTVTTIYKTNDLNSILTAASQSSIPSLIQKNTCQDSALTARAKADVTLPDGSFDTATFTARKQALYNTFCVGDPTRDAKLAQRLQAAYNQDSTMCGSDCFLAIISGDNPYTKTQQALTAIQQDAQAKQQQAADDLKSGGGIASQSVCPDGMRLKTDAEGKPYANPSQAPCSVPETILTPSNVLSDAYKKAISAGEDTLKSTFGTGGISSLLATIIGGINTFSQALNGGVTVTVGTSNTGVVTSNTQPSVQDLTNNSAAKTTLITPIQKQLNSETDALTSLSVTDNNYLAALATYRGQLDNMNSICSDAGLSTANAFYTSKNAAIASTTAILENEQALINTTRDLATNTLTRVLASNSSQDIANIFTSFQNQMDSQNLPTQVTAATREGEYQTFVGNMQEDTGVGGSIATFITRCQSAKAQFSSQ